MYPAEKRTACTWARVDEEVWATGKQYPCKLGRQTKQSKAEGEEGAASTWAQRGGGLYVGWPGTAAAT